MQVTVAIKFSKCRHIVRLIDSANTCYLIKLNQVKMKDEGRIRKLGQGKVSMLTNGTTKFEDSQTWLCRPMW